MQTITFNPENWIADEMTATISGNEIEVQGEKLTLVQQPPLFDENGDVKWDFHCFAIYHEGRKIGSASRFGCDEEFELLGAGIHRQHADPRILAAIYAANCL